MKKASSMDIKRYALEQIGEIVSKKIYPLKFFEDFVEAKEKNDEDLLWELFNYFYRLLENYRDKLVFYVFLYETEDFAKASLLRDELMKAYTGELYEKFIKSFFNLFVNEADKIFEKVSEEDYVPYADWISEETVEEYKKAKEKFRKFFKK